ncbi:hypothetical protein XH93_34890 [Bradyrhizobium sp. CCBAU 51753]|nr:hypothetical protein XH93_34890 [Bradyrhizobium sp. CCBAU 51753]
MTAGLQDDNIAWLQFHDLPSALDDAAGRLASGDDSPITDRCSRDQLTWKTADAALFARGRHQLGQGADDAVRLDRGPRR